MGKKPQIFLIQVIKSYSRKCLKVMKRKNEVKEKHKCFVFNEIIMRL